MPSIPIPQCFYHVTDGVDFVANPSVIRLVVVVVGLSSVGVFIATAVILAEEDVLETQVSARPVPGWSCQHISRLWTEWRVPGGAMWEGWSEASPGVFHTEIGVGYRGTFMETYEDCLDTVAASCSGLAVQYVTGSSGGYVCSEPWWVCQVPPTGRPVGHPGCLAVWPYPNSMDIELGGHAVSGFHLAISSSTHPDAYKAVWDGADPDNMSSAEIAAHGAARCEELLRSDLCAKLPEQICAPFKTHFPPYACSRTRMRTGLEITNVAFAGANLVWSVAIALSAIVLKKLGTPVPNPSPLKSRQVAPTAATSSTANNRPGSGASSEA